MASHNSRKRSYRHRIRCEKCQKDMNSDYKESHIKNKHNGQYVKFTIIQDQKQSRLCFGLSSSTIPKSEVLLLDSVDISSSIENDPEIKHITDTEKADSVNISSFIENDPELDNIIDAVNSNNVDISSSIENCPRIAHIIETDPHYTIKNKENTVSQTLGTAENVDISSFIETDPETENITDTDQNVNMPDKEDTKSKTKGKITEVLDGRLDEKKSVFIKNIYI